ncbi:anoctamin-7 isoform X1 [Mus musculus]|uniref:Anoctamin-7 n=1 Tax=Mus musculus TaxID=10090 RepID=ANO7_MOUSE|nr:anoctamin-7 isoform 1 [Mus musculus]XP_006529796.1 anoctamin-7 isoform X1 [Mus musculus]Q14AT5.2 RecName: Full=Anoctamin-7; AltName: Full=New gene expressed in prostate homolog; AltName: Full=Transmembrane protein 16G [Mus musculus]DAA04566.1 TPA_exp: NGEP [Mus musculus]|eukprot:NP_996914.1 anoctamin-7 isoform 1 [Mus musculus]
MLRGQAREEDSVVLIDMASPEAGNGCSYGSTAQASEAGKQQVAPSRVGSSAKPPIDFVLVWEEDLRNQENPTKDKTDTHEVWRETFLENLCLAGLKIDQHDVQDEAAAVHYILLRAPWAVLCYYAEDLRLKLPLQELPNQASNWSATLLEWLGIPNILLEHVPDTPPEYYSCQFKASKLQWFLGSDNQDTFFTSTKRHQILFEILAKTPYGHEKKGLFGIDQLLAEGVFSAAFPLHDGPFSAVPESSQVLGLIQRQVLFQHWARWGKWNKYQPLDHVRRYFGEKVALYFAWLGFYTGWLLPAAVVGTVVFLVGCFLVFSDIPTQELCHSSDSFDMCPLCSDCSFWLLSSACTLAQAGRLFDHGGTVFFSLFMALWAVLLLEYWKRKNATLAYRWDCSDYEDIEERPRPQFAATAPMTALNPITGEDEPYFPEKNRVRRMLAGSVVLLMMVAVVIMCLVSVILYRAVMAIIVSRSDNAFLSAWASRIASLTGSVVNLVFILILSKVYVLLAQVLTRWEMHRTQTEFEDAFTLKVFIFQFVNFYASPVYIAFFKGRFVGYPGNYHTLFGIRNEECPAGGCLSELAQELLVIMVGKQIINNVQEVLVPKLKGCWQKFSRGKKAGTGTHPAPWEADYELLPCEGLFHEYLEMVLQFGFVTIFVAACPLAPLFALLNNWVEIRLDARKFVCEYRRPVAERAQDIGIWFHILTGLTHLAVISNAFLLAFSSDFLPRVYYSWTHAPDLHGFLNFTLARAPPTFTSAHNRTCRYRAFRDDDGHYSPTYWTLLAIRLAFVIVFEHVVFSIGRVLDLLVPDIPESVEIKVKREYYLAKQALAENEALLGATGVKDDQPPSSEPSLGLPA